MHIVKKNIMKMLHKVKLKIKTYQKNIIMIIIQTVAKTFFAINS